LRVTESSGATMEQIERRTGLMRDQLVLPMALLMKTDRLHFTRFGEKDIYVSKGRAPEEPVTPPPAKKRKEPAAVETSADGDAEDATEAKDDAVAADEPPARRRRFVRDKGDDEDIEPTASVLVFGKRKPKEAPKPPKKKSKKAKKS